MIAPLEGTVVAMSNSASPGERPLAYAADFLQNVVGSRRLVHLPYAAVKPTDFASLRAALDDLGAAMKTVDDPHDAAQEIARAEVILVTGGNTFSLLSTLQRHRLVKPIRDAVRTGATYVGISAGANIVSPTIATTNSMPIVTPHSLDSLGLIQVQLNVHYPGPHTDPSHSGESRDDRISEYVHHNNRPVLALRESSWVARSRGQLALHGVGAREFRIGQPPLDLVAGADLTHLL